jgi:hypothetical protein
MNAKLVIAGSIALLAVAGFALMSIPPVSAMGTVKLYVTDPPRYSETVTHIYITFDKIEICAAGGNESWVKLSGNTTTIDLLQLVNSTESLGNFSIPAGNYSQIRLMTPAATAVVGNETIPLTIPSGSQTGLKVHFGSPMVLDPGGSVSITLDISADGNEIHNGKLVPSLHAYLST